MMRIRVDKLAKTYNRRTIFKDVSFELLSGESIVISGANGSGKSTLCKIIAGLIKPARGRVLFELGQSPVAVADRFRLIGMVSPYLQLYKELSPFENGRFFANIQGQQLENSRFKRLIDQMGLAGREFDPLGTFSSGMLQRMKYVIALYHQPELLILDEPTANLDVAGTQAVYEIMETQRKMRALIVATNEPDETRFGTKYVGLDP